MAPAQNGVAKPGAKLRVFSPNEAFYGGAQRIEYEWRNMFRKIYEAKPKARAPPAAVPARRPPSACSRRWQPLALMFALAHAPTLPATALAAPPPAQPAQVDSNLRASGPGCPQEELARAMSRNRCAARPQTPFARPPALGGSSAVPRPAAFAWS